MARVCPNWNNKEVITKMNQVMNKLGQSNLTDLEIDLLKNDKESFKTFVDETRLKATYRAYNIYDKTLGDVDIFLNYNPDLTFDEAVEEFKKHYNIPHSFKSIDAINNIFKYAKVNSKYDAIKFGIKTVEGNRLQITYNRKDEEFYQTSKTNENEIQYVLKAISIFQSDKAKQVFEKGKKANWPLDRILTELQISKEQKQLILDLGKTNREEIITDLLASYSYTIEINTAKEKAYKGYNTEREITFIKDGWNYKYDQQFEGTKEEYRKIKLVAGQLETKYITKEEFEKFSNEVIKDTPTQHYSDQTVNEDFYKNNPDWEYRIQQIVTPNITPSIQNHNFGTKEDVNKIGWFRAWYNKKTGEVHVLEVQSDLFQKWRNNFEFEDNKYTAKKDDKNVWHYYKNGNEINANEYTKIWNTFLETYLDNADAFTKLLQKDNNWVTFFVKAIIQDSAKKGYEKVLFPSGNTASKVEGHTTLEEFKKQKEDRIKELEKQLEKPEYVVDWVDTSGYAGNNIVFKTEQEALDYIKTENAKLPEDVEGGYQSLFNGERLNREINQLKQELERVEKEGFGALKPIYNFYENTVTNILNKTYGKENVRQITDEYGNTWNEVEIKPEFANKSIALQLSSKTSQKPDEKLTETLKLFLSKLGVDYKAVNEIFDNNGKEIDAIAKTTIIKENLQKIIEVVEGKADITTLPEETAHILLIMMRGTKLYQTMMDDIIMYPEYDEVKREYGKIYNNNENKIREEACAKLISQRVIQQYKEGISEPRFNRVQRWWNQIVDWFKEKLGIIDSDPYTKAAKKILFGDTNQLSDKRINNEYFFQIDNSSKDQAPKAKQFAVFSKLEDEELNISLNENTHKYSYKGVEVAESVTEFRDKENKSYVNKRDISNEEEANNEVLRVWGVKGHADFQNIITRLIEERQGNQTTARVHNLPLQYYNELEKYCKDLLDSFPIDTIFKSEIKIIDPKANKGKGRAGTIDFLAIEPDGKTHILDWKFINFSDYDRLEGTVPFYKKKDFDVQLTEYKRILRKAYNVDSFGMTRVIPIRMKYKTYDPVTERHGRFLAGLEIGEITINKEKLYLNPLPIQDERTGNETVDEIINGLQQQLKDTLIDKPISPTQKLLRNRRIKRLNEAIKELQLTQTLDKFFEDANYELRFFNNITNLEDFQLKEGKKLIEFYKTIDFSDFINKYGDNSEDLKRFKEKAATFTVNLNKPLKKINEEIKRRLEIKAAEEWNINSINNSQIDITKLGKNWRSFSQQNHPKIKALWKLVSKSKDATIDALDELNKKIQSSVEKVINYAKLNNLKADNYFDFMIDTKADGTISLIKPYDKSIYTAINTAKQAKNYDALYGKESSFYEWNEEKYNKDLEDEKAYWKEIYRNDADRQTKVKKRIETFVEKYDAKNSKKAILIASKKYFTLKDNPNFYSKKYKEIVRNPELKEFYDLFINFMDESKDWLGDDENNKLSDNFLPQVLKSTVELFQTQGLDAIKGLKDSFFSSLEARETGDGIVTINKLTGQIERKIPIYYNFGLKEQASKDLGKVLSLWAMMAYNYKHMSEIETSAHMLLDAFKNEKIIKVDLLGKPVKNADGKYEEIIGKSNNLDAFVEYMNEYLYGVKTDGTDWNWSKKSKEKDEEGNEIEVETIYSGRKALNKSIKYFTQKSLFGNLISGTANLVGAISNVIIEGAGGRFYNKTDFIKSVNRLKSGFLDKKNTVLLRYFDIMGDMEGFNKADALSVRAAERFFTADKWYFLQKGGDSLTLNTILGAMLTSHGLDANGKIKHIRELPKGTKSLYDSAEIVNDKVVIKGLTDTQDNEEYKKFRKKILEIGKITMGMSPTYDSRLVNNTILGQLFMTFRNWIPRMVDTRFGDLRYNETLEDYELGRYRSFANFLFNKQLPLRLLELVKGFGIAGFGLGINVDEYCKILYNNLSEEEQSKVSLEKFTALHKANLQSCMMEIQLLLSIAALLLLAKPDDDDEDETKIKYLVKVLDRSLNEISFFISPDSFNQIIKTPLPLMGMVTDIGNFISHTGGETLGIVTGNEDIQKANKPTKYLFKSFPITSEAVRNIEVFNKNYFNE